MKDIIEIFKALSDETRLRIIKLLLRRELCVCEMVDALQMPQYHVSRHLGILKRAGLVDDSREGTWMYYSLRVDDTMKKELINWIDNHIKAKIINEDQQRLTKRLNLRVQDKCVLGYKDQASTC